MSSNKKKAPRRTLAARVHGLADKIDVKNPAWLFLAFVVIAGLLIVRQIIPPGFLSSTTKNFSVTLEHQRKNITHLDQARDTFATDSFAIDTVNFPTGNALVHASLGNYDFSKNFFMKLTGEVNVLKADVYRFIVASDDGFRLVIDGKNLSQHTNDRPMTETATNVRLTAGRHKIELFYFQGFGQLGLQAWYENSVCGKRFLGEASDCLRFIAQE